MGGKGGTSIKDTWTKPSRGYQGREVGMPGLGEILGGKGR